MGNHEAIMVNGKGRRRGRKVGLMIVVKVRQQFRKKENRKEFGENLWAKLAVSVKWCVLRNLVVGFKDGV